MITLIQRSAFTWVPTIHCGRLSTSHSTSTSSTFEDITGWAKKWTNFFCQNFVKSPPNLIIFGIQITKTIEICKVHSMSTSPNLCQCTTV